MPQGDLNEFERGVLANVEQHGCHINFVFDPDGDAPAFAYSVGFPKSVGQPEVIVFGLPRTLMQAMINILYGQCSDGLELEDGIRLPGLLEGFDCVAKAVPEEALKNDHFASAKWFARTQMDREMDTPFQIFWPGADDGLFPWDEGADPELVEDQCELFKGQWS